MEKVRNVNIILVEKLEREDPSEDVGVNGRIV
jgi:hypothetical protein